MIGLDFTCHEPRMSFGENFNVWGGADEFAWRDNGNWPGHEVPDLGGRELSWHLETERSVFDYYNQCLQEAGRSMPTRIPEFASFWRNANAMLWQFEPDLLSLTIGVPADERFVAFLSSVVSAGMSLRVRLPLTTFASRDDAAAPTADAFMHRHEPVFFTEPAVFTPFRRVVEPDEVAAPPRLGRRFFR